MGIKIVYKLYSLLWIIISPILVLRLYLKKNPAYKKNIKERFGIYAEVKSEYPIWIHAVSLGESIAAGILIKKIINEFPDKKVIVTNMTPTGKNYINNTFPSISCCYCPYEITYCIKRFINTYNPKICIIMETEIWPNLLRYNKIYDIENILVNARLSDKSYRGYARVKSIIQDVLSDINNIYTQSENDSNNFIKLGYNKKYIKCLGNIKFDNELSDFEIIDNPIRKILSDQKSYFCAISTHTGEDEILLDAYNLLLESLPNLVIIIIPRHSERFEQVYELSSKKFKTQKRSNDNLIDLDTRVIIGDSMGEIKYYIDVSKYS